MKLMSFKHLRVITNSASKCLKITLKLIKFSKPENFLKKNKLRGISPLESFEGRLIPPHPSGRNRVGESVVAQTNARKGPCDQ
jgi:hypothetical protein